MKDIITLDKHPPDQVVDYLQTHVPLQSLIETPEYELVFLDDKHHFHLMPAFFIVESDEKGVVLLNPRRSFYNFNQTKADFLILGSFGKIIFAQVYPPDQVARHWRKVAKIDIYDIYQRRSSSSPDQTQSRLRPPKPRSWPPLKAESLEAHDSSPRRHPLSH